MDFYKKSPIEDLFFGKIEIRPKKSFFGEFLEKF